jgi:hypothetical protein
MKFVYPTRSNKEAKYLKASIRSVAKLYPDAEIVIIGNKPSWLRRCTHIQFNEKALSKPYINVWLKMLIACNKFNEPFIWMNDDFILNTPFSWEDSQMYYKDLSYRKSGVSEGNFYNTRINRTFSLLEGMKLGNECYDIHQPMIIDPTVIKWMNYHLKMLDNAYLFKTIYGQVTKSAYKQYEYSHCKINSMDDYLEDMVYFSASEKWNNEDLKKLNALFPEKCIFEKAR